MGTPHLLPSLARAVRGLSALFWGLPLALLACVKTAMGDSWRAFGTWGSPLFRNQGWTGFLIDLIQACLPATAALVLLLYGLRNLARFQSQERIWIGALDRATILNSLLLALVPFAHWWSIRPFDPFYTQSLGLMIFSGIGFMMAVNRVLLRLAAMLPDEVLRSDTRLFSQVNAGLIGLLGLLIATQILAQSRPGWCKCCRFAGGSRCGGSETAGGGAKGRSETRGKEHTCAGTKNFKRIRRNCFWGFEGT